MAEPKWLRTTGCLVKGIAPDPSGVGDMARPPGDPAQSADVPCMGDCIGGGVGALPASAAAAAVASPAGAVGTGPTTMIVSYITRV